MVGAAALATLMAGCGIFEGTGPTQPAPTGSETPGTSISLVTAAPTEAPTATPRIVKSVTLVASIGAPKDWTPAGLAWSGIQAVAGDIGADTSVVQPVSNADLMAMVEGAGKADGAVVVTVGAAADPAVQAAAAAHPTTQFFEIDVAVPEGSPPNVHGLVFDEAEAGYLAGYVAAAYAASGKIGMVGDTETDAPTGNYLAGFRNGASQATPGIAVTVAYGASPDLPDRGRTAAASLVKAGSTVVLAMPGLTGIGALREACARNVRVVALDTDAWQIVPDIRSCLIVSVMKRYDVAVATAIAALAAGRIPATLTLCDVASGGIALSDFHADLPAGFQGRLDALTATLRNGPPHPSPAPPSAAPSTAASISP